MGTSNSQVESEAMDNVLTKEDKDKWFSSLQTMHLTAAIFMGVQAIAYGAAIGDTTASTTPTVSFQGSSNDECEGLSCSINIKSVGEFDTLWMMPVFVAMASLDHIICYTYSKVYPESAMSWIFDVKSNPARWIEYSLSASLMALALTALCRITDVHLWFLIFFMTAIGMGCGQVLELLPYPGSPEDKSWPLPTSCATLRTLVFTLGSFSIFLPWLVMMCTMPDFVYAAFLLTLVFFICFGVNSFCCNVLGLYPFHRAEFIYIILSFTAKTFLCADVFGGLKAAED